MKKKLMVLVGSLLLFLVILGCNVYLHFQQRTPKEQQGTTSEEQEKVDVEGTLYNVYIESGSKKKITAFIQGKEMTLPTKDTLSQDISKVVGDIEVENGVITKVSIKPETIKGKVLSISDKKISLENYGKLDIGKGYKVYRVYGGVIQEMPSSVLVGYENTEFVVAKGKICAALITEALKVENIRVLLKTNHYENVYHPKVTVTSEQPFTISWNGKTKKYKAKQQVTFTPKSNYFKKDGIVKIQAENKEKVKVTSLTRSGEAPSYRGVIELQKQSGGLLMINELPLESYLYGVIGSEMPVSYGVEALKVQAVCARSYAYKQLLYNGCGEYGAHVDDSVSYQVYNNVPESATTIEAVDATEGLVMKDGEGVITAYYFSTSCGHTSTASEVWLGENQGECLKGKLQVEEEKTLDLTKEDTFRKFIEDSTYETYDSDFPWYRWKVAISGEELKASIDKNLRARYEKKKDYILTLQKNGSYKKEPIDTIGVVKDIQILQRKTGGIVTAVKIVGSERTIKVYTEYNIRLLLAPLTNTITRNDKTTIDGLSMLPSAFFYLDRKQSKGDATFSFTGGGYGHGAGMSQNGVKTMVDKGKRYEEILKHYYGEISLESCYSK